MAHVLCLNWLVEGEVCRTSAVPTVWQDGVLGLVKTALLQQQITVKNRIVPRII